MVKDDTAVRRITATIPEEYALGLEDVADTMNVSLSEALREAVGTYLMQYHWKAVGESAKKEILAGKTNEQVLASVKKAFPVAQTSMKSVAWYRSKLRREMGADRVPSDSMARGKVGG